jgi:membrane protease YdiL (CAAX protease family)
MAAAHSTSPEEQSQRSTLRKIFCNQRGLRSGWRLTLYLTLILAIAFALHLVFSSVGVEESLPKTFSMAAVFLMLFLPAVVMSKIEKRSIEAYGLPVHEAFGKPFLQGCAIGIIEVTILVGLLALVRDYSFGPLIVGGKSLVNWGMECATDSMAKALCFQFLFRGYTQFTLAEGISFWSAAVALSALYMVIIAAGTGLNLIGLPIVFIVGLLCSFTLCRTHSLWFAIGLNAAFDFGGTFLYSVPNHPLGSLSDHHLSEAALHGSAWLTGGTMGVEGSPLRIVTVGILIFLVNKFYPAKTSEGIA